MSAQPGGRSSSSSGGAPVEAASERRVHFPAPIRCVFVPLTPPRARRTPSEIARSLDELDDPGQHLAPGAAAVAASGAEAASSGGISENGAPGVACVAVPAHGGVIDDREPAREEGGPSDEVPTGEVLLGAAAAPCVSTTTRDDDASAVQAAAPQSSEYDADFVQ